MTMEEIKELIEQQQKMIKDLTDQVKSQQVKIAELKAATPPAEEKPKEATSAELDAVFSE